MEKNAARVRLLLHVLLIILFSAWLLLFYSHPVEGTADSAEYATDAQHLTDPGYHLQRPFLYPAYVRLLGTTGAKLSIVSFLLNLASLLYLLHLSGAGSSGPMTTGSFKKLFSPGNTAILAAFLLWPGIWSYCGVALTESILFSVTCWIFILLVRLLLPVKQHSLLSIIGYCILIDILAIILKPWLLIFVLVLGSIGCLAALIYPSFRPARRSCLVLLTISILSFTAGYRYNQRKSPVSDNIVLLLISSGKEEELKERLNEDTQLSTRSAGFIRLIIDDIDRINGQYGGDPWYASDKKDLKVLNISDTSYAASVRAAFRVSYLERPKDMMGLAALALSRYTLSLRMGSACLGVAYGPVPAMLKGHISPLLIFLFLLGIMLFFRPALFPAFRKIDKKLLVFTGIMLLSSILFSLLLCIAGGAELPRTVLPAILFQLFALTWAVTDRRPSPLPAAGL